MVHHHTRGVVSTSVSRARLLVLLVLALATALAGCTWAHPPNAPALPAEQFPAIVDRDPDVVTHVNAFAAAGDEVVAAATSQGRIGLPTFWHSSDAGQTWTQGALSAVAARATEISESRRNLAAVRSGAEGNSWLALGQYDTTVLAWTSRDGLTWERATANGLVAARDYLAEVVATPTGFAIAGSTWDPNTGTHTPRVWTSPDGITWTGQAPAGAGRLHSVAVRDTTWVAVGTHELPARSEDGRLGSPVVLVSTDSGTTWQSATIPEPEGETGFWAGLTTVRWSGDRFVAGGSFYTGEASTYRGWVAESADGVTWTPPWPVPSSATSSAVVKIVPTGAGDLLLERERAGSRETVAARARARTADGKWSRQDIPSLPGRGWHEASVAAGDAVLWAVANDLTRTESRMWRTTDLGATWEVITLPAPEGMGPRVEPRDLTLHDGVLTSWGNAQGATVVWTRDEDGGWAPPRVVRDQERESYHGVRAGPAGWLLLGSKAGDAQVLTSPDAQTWRESGPGTFNEVAQYHSSSVHDATWFRDRWVVVGDRSTNGNVRTSALVASSADGSSWTPGRHTTVFQEGDAFGDELATDLDGLENRGRVMRAVAEVPGGLLAAGEVTAAEGTRPAAWTSADGDAWRLAELPSDGYLQGRAFGVLSHGDTILVRGSGIPLGEEDSVPLLWRSTDAGATFALGRLGDQGRAESVHGLSDARGFVVVVGQPGSAPPTLWLSTDGATWTPQPLTLPGKPPTAEAWVHDAILDGDTLLLLVSIANRLDAVPIVVEVPRG